TDRNPTYAWVDEELAKARADYNALYAKATAIQATISSYETRARELDAKGIVQQDLLRIVKTDEENYLAYQRKREEARMTDALDRTRILNVTVAEQPSVPAIPSNTPLTSVVVGFMLAVTMSLGTALALERFDSSFRTPTEVVAELQIPVLAAVTFKVDASFKNGDGSGNGKHRPKPEHNVNNLVICSQERTAVKS